MAWPAIPEMFARYPEDGSSPLGWVEATFLSTLSEEPSVAAVLLIVAVTTMPWAIYNSAPTGLSASVGGEVGRVVLWLATGELIVTMCLWIKSDAMFGVAAVSVGAGSIVAAPALALDSIARANSASRYSSSPSHTTYGVGSAVGPLAAVGMIVLASLAVSHVTRQRSDRVHRPGASPKKA
jgi:hypothetical protein